LLMTNIGKFISKKSKCSVKKCNVSYERQQERTGIKKPVRHSIVKNSKGLFLHFLSHIVRPLLT
jgi:hypothetical protein